MTDKELIPAYTDDIDKMLSRLADSVPTITSEQIYLYEIENQTRIYLALIVVGMLMVALVVLL